MSEYRTEILLPSFSNLCTYFWPNVYTLPILDLECSQFSLQTRFKKEGKQKEQFHYCTVLLCVFTLKILSEEKKQLWLFFLTIPIRMDYGKMSVIPVDGCCACVCSTLRL